ncbi:hypothetical protein V6N13_050443 [Hibiscus sabdariffa]
MILAVKPLNHIGNLKELARIIANSISEWNIEVCSITLDHLHFKDDKAIQAIKEVCNLSTTKWFVSLDLELYDLGIWPRQEDIGLGLTYLKEICNSFGGICFSDASLYLSKLWTAHLELSNASTVIGDLKVELLHRRFGWFFSLCKNDLNIASMLDPRLKLPGVYFSFSREGVSKSDREEERNGFNTRLFDTYKGLEEEYSNYLAQQLLAISPNEVEPLLPALKWWRANSRTFPNFAKMARDFLPMPRTLGALNLKFQKKMETLKQIVDEKNVRSIEPKVPKENQANGSLSAGLGVLQALDGSVARPGDLVGQWKLD